MNVCSIGFGFPYIGRQTAQTQSSVILRTAAIACGMIALTVGLLAIYGMLGMHQLGTTIGGIGVALGSVSILMGLCLKCVSKSSWPKPVRHEISLPEPVRHAISWPKPIRHAIYNRDISVAAPIEIELNTGSALAALPKDVLYQMLALLELPDLFRLSKTSKEMYTKIDRYLLYRCPIKSTLLSDYNCPATKMEDVGALGYTQLVLELCERDSEYKPQTLTFERFREILQLLKEKNLLFLLNAIPIPPWLTKDFRPERSIFSSLQYWAGCGKIEYVKLLVKHGAKDYFSSCPAGDRSALFCAAICGEVEIVNYLLENGAHAGIHFEQDFLRSFIPDLVYHSSFVIQTGDPSRQIQCFKRIVEYMIIYQPEEFRFQLRVPISEGSNIMRCTQYSIHPYKKSVYEILKRYGANERDVQKAPKEAKYLFVDHVRPFPSAKHYARDSREK